MSIFQRTILWQQTNTQGSDHCTLWQNEDGWQLDGLILKPEAQQPAMIQYRVQCNHDWETRYVLVSVVVAGEETVLPLHVDDDQRWWTGKTEHSGLRGCYDVDLGFTPATNTLPIRRLGLALGQAQELSAAWVRYPELTVEPLNQRYTHISDTQYRYESRDGQYVADINVDDLGLVTNYPDLWHQLATSAK